MTKYGLFMYAYIIFDTVQDSIRTPIIYLERKLFKHNVERTKSSCVEAND